MNRTVMIEVWQYEFLFKYKTVFDMALKDNSIQCCISVDIPFLICYTLPRARGILFFISIYKIHVY